ncbi:MAG: hypothetical protein HJJLKODD_02225 [Phycisphaerae bacterium]|nr:hypothetical protein [Phycisphaerae bacterium]
MKSGPIRAVLFDWGNTLANVNQEGQIMLTCARQAFARLQQQGLILSAQAAEEFIHAYQLASRQQNYAAPTYPELDVPQMLREWLSMRLIDQPLITTALLTEVLSIFWNNWINGLSLLDHADQVLINLQRLGLATGLVSNVTAPASYCLQQLDRLGLRAGLQTFTFSSEVGYRKPNPRIYFDALGQLRRLPGWESIEFEEILFVGDWPIGDVLGPARLGMTTALIRHPRIDTYWPEEDYHFIQPTWTISYLADLEHILANSPHPTVRASLR